jgi:hypothetical protein
MKELALPDAANVGMAVLSTTETTMDLKSSISLVNVQKPTANTPILQRRSKLISNLDQQINKIRLYKDGRRVSREAFWIGEAGAIFFQLRYGKQPLELQKGKSTLRCASFDELETQIEEIKKLAFAGDLDDALALCATQVRSNFKVAKDKKAGKAA